MFTKGGGMKRTILAIVGIGSAITMFGMAGCFQQQAEAEKAKARGEFIDARLADLESTKQKEIVLTNDIREVQQLGEVQALGVEHSVEDIAAKITNNSAAFDLRTKTADAKWETVTEPEYDRAIARAGQIDNIIAGALSFGVSSPFVAMLFRKFGGEGSLEKFAGLLEAEKNKNPKLAEALHESDLRTVVAKALSKGQQKAINKGRVRSGIEG